MDDDDAVVEGAPAIRPYLGRLAGSSAVAAELDRHLADALNGSSGRQETARQLRNLPDGQEDTAWFLAQVLADVPHCRPPYYQPYYWRSLAGIPAPIPDESWDLAYCYGWPDSRVRRPRWWRIGPR
jgi:hypothetical protein